MLMIAVISLFTLMFFGVPITFSLMGSGFLAVALTGEIPMYINAQRFIGGVNSFTLMAIPLFIIAGAIMNQGGLSSKIIHFCSTLLSWVRGGVGCVTVASNMVFGAVSGSGTAAVSAIGSMTAPEMEKMGYEKRFIGAMIAGAASTAPIIPPSNTMIIFASITGMSVASLFMGGFVPGITIGLILMVICHFYAKKHDIDYGGKFVPKDVLIAFKDCFWALIMPVIIIGGVASGFCTATEAGAIACVYGLVVSFFIYKQLKITDLYRVLRKAAVSTGQVLSLYAASTVYGYIFTVENFGPMFEKWLLGITDSPIVIMLMICAVMVVIGCFMEPVAVMPVMLPIVFPLLQSLGCNMIQFGIMFSMSVIIGGLTPPVGSYLFVTCSVIKESVIKLIPWMMVMVAVDIFVILLVIFFEPFATFLPAILGYT